MLARSLSPVAHEISDKVNPGVQDVVCPKNRIFFPNFHILQANLADNK
jgi:hypothetical protein